MIKDVRKRVYFAKPKGVSQQRSLGNTVLDGGEWSVTLPPKNEAGVEPLFGLDKARKVKKFLPPSGQQVLLSEPSNEE